jgi:Domain of unknown function (DUF4372)
LTTFSGKLPEFFPEVAMNVGKTLFAQIMDFLPWTTFTRYVERYGGDSGVRTMTCAEQYRIMAFAQLTYRESLRDIEACLGAQTGKLYHMGFRGQMKRLSRSRAQQRNAALARRAYLKLMGIAVLNPYALFIGCACPAFFHNPKFGTLIAWVYGT